MPSILILTLVFCASQTHALAVRDLINQMKTSKEPNYCHRVTADDGLHGEQHLRDFQDNEKSIPTILTMSQKLTIGSQDLMTANGLVGDRHETTDSHPPA